MLIHQNRGLSSVSKKPTAHIRDWTIVNNRIYGRITGHPSTFHGAYQVTSELVSLDLHAMRAETQNTIYVLNPPPTKDVAIRDYGHLPVAGGNGIDPYGLSPGYEATPHRYQGLIGGEHF